MFWPPAEQTEVLDAGGSRERRDNEVVKEFRHAAERGNVLNARQFLFRGHCVRLRWREACVHWKRRGLPGLLQECTDEDFQSTTSGDNEKSFMLQNVSPIQLIANKQYCC